MAKAKEEKFDVAQEWNTFVKSLIQVRRSWEKLSGFFLNAGNVDSITEEWSSHIMRVCKTTRFGFAMEDFIRLCGVRGSIEDYIIKINKKGE